MSGIMLFSGTVAHVSAQTTDVVDLRASVQSDAYALLDLIDDQFAYADRFPNGQIPVRRELEGRVASLSTRNDLIAFSQMAFHSLYDHHSITGAGLPDAYGLVPSFADLWIERRPAGYEIVDVRRGSPALKAGIRPGCYLTHVEGRPIEDAVRQFIGPGIELADYERMSYAARVLATGRRDRVRRLGLQCDDLNWTLEIPTLYQSRLKRDPGLVSLERVAFFDKTIGVIRVNDSLGQTQTIAAFDQALQELDGVDGLVIDLRDTASGGNTLVARGILSRFVEKTEYYQRHILPNEERDFGIVRSWVEEVTPRGTRFEQPVAIVSGRWTASMGEGLTIAFDALGVKTFGSKMAGLLGGITDHRLPETGVTVKLTTEKLTHIDGTPRENFSPAVSFNYADAPDLTAKDGPMEAAMSYLVSSEAQ